MNFLVTPNALKGSLSATDAAAVIGKALHEIFPDANCRPCPIGDGGDGTLDCLVHATRGEFFSSRVHGPLASMEVTARWGVLGDKTTALVEMAEAAGLRLLKPSQYDVMSSTTTGVGELIAEALNKGYEKIIVGLGGSATNDGGMGCCRALGAKFLDSNGRELPDGGGNLSRLGRIEYKREEMRDKKIEIVALSDVTNVLCGPEGASFTFAGQKGATAEQVAELDAGLSRYATLIERDLHRKVAEIAGSGAAGGLGAGLVAFCDATIESGIDFVLDLIGFDKFVQECDCIITAEGMIDSQTLRGKGTEGVARRARQFNKPVHAFVGRIGGDTEFLRRQLGLASIHEISPAGTTIEGSMKNAGSFLSQKIREVFSK
jgi:glycerate 2-kinase